MSRSRRGLQALRLWTAGAEGIKSLLFRMKFADDRHATSSRRLQNVHTRIWCEFHSARGTKAASDVRVIHHWDECVAKARQAMNTCTLTHGHSPAEVYIGLQPRCFGERAFEVGINISTGYSASFPTCTSLIDHQSKGALSLMR